MYEEPEIGDNLQALEDLVRLGYFENPSPAYGIAKLYIHEGESKLSSKQKYIFEKQVAPILFKTCEACGNDIELSALPLAYEDSIMLCSYHRYIADKERDK